MTRGRVLRLICWSTGVLVVAGVSALCVRILLVFADLPVRDANLIGLVAWPAAVMAWWTPALLIEIDSRPAGAHRLFHQSVLAQAEDAVARWSERSQNRRRARWCAVVERCSDGTPVHSSVDATLFGHDADGVRIRIASGALAAVGSELVFVSGRPGRLIVSAKVGDFSRSGDLEIHVVWDGAPYWIRLEPDVDVGGQLDFLGQG